MARIKPRILKGFRDYTPDVMIARRDMLNKVCAVFERYGFSPLDTPALEYSEILLGKYGADAEKLLYRFEDNGKRDICLRYDLTLPLARVVGQHGELPRPFKRYQVGNVWRAESPGRGRYREFTQCDIDIVGSSSLTADAECLVVDVAVMQALGVNAVVRMNNRKVFRGLQERLGIESEREMNDVLRVIDKLPKVGEEGVRKELAESLKLSEARIESVITFCSISGSNDEVLAKLTELMGESEIGEQGIAELRQVLEYAFAQGVEDEDVQLDPSIARGLDYYTGTVFETFLRDLPDFGSVMSGGRYDDLIGLYASEQIPAVGVSVGLDRLLAGLIELNAVRERKTVTEVLVTVFSPETLSYAMQVAATLRDANVKTELFLDPDAKIRKQMKYANNLNIPCVAIAGPDEAEKREVSLRDMIGGEQAQVQLDELGAVANQWLGRVRGFDEDHRSWAWPWEPEVIKRVSEVRGLYILRGASREALEVGYVDKSRLKSHLLSLVQSPERENVVSFDWYEIGDTRLGNALEAFLSERLLGNA